MEQHIALTCIRPPRKYGRPVDLPTVDAIAESIKEIGLRQPITVRRIKPDDDEAKAFDYIIITGQHRFNAVQKLRQETIACWLMELDDLRTELWTIDENLLRSECSSSERVRNITRRKHIYEALHPQTKHGANAKEAANIRWANAKRHSVVSHNKSADESSEAETTDVPPPTFTEDTAARTGRNQRSVQRDVRRGENVSAKALDMITGTHLDTGVMLDRLANLSHSHQARVLEVELDPEHPEHPLTDGGATMSPPEPVTNERNDELEPESTETLTAASDTGESQPYTPPKTWNATTQKWDGRGVIAARKALWHVHKDERYKIALFCYGWANWRPECCSLCSVEPITAYNKGYYQGYYDSLEQLLDEKFDSDFRNAVKELIDSGRIVLDSDTSNNNY